MSSEIKNEYEKNIISFFNSIREFRRPHPDIIPLYKMLCVIYDDFISFDEYKEILLKIKRDGVFGDWLII